MKRPETKGRATPSPAKTGAVTKAFSLDPELDKEMEARIEQLQQSNPELDRSSYIRSLIRDDVAKRQPKAA